MPEKCGDLVHEAYGLMDNKKSPLREPKSEIPTNIGKDLRNLLSLPKGVHYFPRSQGMPLYN
jgi:hypothetical protein